MRRHPWLTAAIFFAVLCGVLYFAMEWHAERRWQRYAADARRQGVKLYPAKFVPQKIPDAQNFAALPLFKKALAAEKFESPFRLPATSHSTLPVGPVVGFLLEDRPPTFGNMRKGEKIDWPAWRQYFLAVGFLTEASDNPVRDVLHALDHYAPAFQEWSEWRTSRPLCQFPVGQGRGKSYSSTIFVDAVALFRLRISAHLADGDPAAAYADFQDGCQAPRALQSEPELIYAMRRAGMMHLLLEAVGGGLQDRTWTDAELQKIDRDLAALDLWKEYHDSLAAQREQLNVDIEKMMNQSFRERRRTTGFQLYLFNLRTQWLFQVMPRSGFRNNQWRMNRYVDELIAAGNRPGQSFNPDRETPSAPRYLNSFFDRQCYFLCGLIGENYASVEKQFIGLQTAIDQTRLACALERSRLARGGYPATLAEMVPDFITAVPIDIYAGAPYHYQRIGAYSFRLYGVGENRTDDGGIVTRRDSPDAVWLYAPRLPAP